MRHITRLMTVSLVAGWTALILACGGGGSHPKPEPPSRGTDRQDVSHIDVSEGRSEGTPPEQPSPPAQRNPADVAYEEEVERQKIAYEAALEKYVVDWEEFERRDEAYQSKKAEYLATKLLNVARSFAAETAARRSVDERRVSLETAHRRYREVIAAHPRTQAAADAKILLDGGLVDARKTPAEPIAPSAPLEPHLVLPPRPEVATAGREKTDADHLAGAHAATDYQLARTGAYQTPITLANGKTVFVQGYYRKDGTYVRPHVRSAPSLGGRRR